MSRIVTKHDYHGVSPEHIDMLEQISQATLTQMYSYADAVFCDPKIELWNCSVYRSRLDRNGDKHRRLRIVSHSSGYWVVIELGKPSFCRLPKYKDTVDFWLFAAQTHREDKLSTKPVDWETYMLNWGLSTCDLFWQARKLNLDVGWYAPTHVIDFKHPLLSLLRQGIEKHTEETLHNKSE